VEPLVEKLVDMGADVNACNSFGYSCILEACHRGYIVVAKTLLKGGVDLAYIPNEEQAGNSPFASAPCQSALAEAARSGFFKVVQVGTPLLLRTHSFFVCTANSDRYGHRNTQTLLDAGAPKDLPNRLGWTALHEACFYNRIETVKTLLLGGCNATLRTRLGALPYHLACIPEIKNMLESMGGPGAVPSPGDTIDMLQILTELTMPSEFNIGTQHNFSLFLVVSL
jgi:ankyrin repeat protein